MPRRYTVLRKDLDAYIKDSAEHPEKYFISVTFTSNNPGKREPDKYYLYPHQIPEDFRPWLIDFVCDYVFRIAKKSEKHRKLLDKYFK